MSQHQDQHEHLLQFADRQTAEDVANLVSHFSNPLRLRLLCRLVCGGSLSVGELSEWTGEAQSAVSKQLKSMRLARLVDREKLGTRAYYSVRDPAITQIMMFLADLASRIKKPSGWGG